MPKRLQSECKYPDYVRRRLDGEGVRQAARNAGYPETPTQYARRIERLALEYNQLDVIPPSESDLMEALDDRLSTVEAARREAAVIRRKIRALRIVKGETPDGAAVEA